MLAFLFRACRLSIVSYFQLSDVSRSVREVLFFFAREVSAPLTARSPGEKSRKNNDGCACIINTGKLFTIRSYSSRTIIKMADVCKHASRKVKYDASEVR